MAVYNGQYGNRTCEMKQSRDLYRKLMNTN